MELPEELHLLAVMLLRLVELAENIMIILKILTAKEEKFNSIPNRIVEAEAEEDISLGNAYLEELVVLGRQRLAVRSLEMVPVDVLAEILVPNQSLSESRIVWERSLDKMEAQDLA